MPYLRHPTGAAVRDIRLSLSNSFWPIAVDSRPGLTDRFRCTSANSGESPFSALRPEVDIRNCAKMDVYADLIVWPNF
jgi:hypothetical protein